jgi:transcriptional regulator with XRE-family HTH domain
MKSVNRKKVIKYDPKKSVEQLAKSNGVTVPTIRKYIRDKNIDRKRDERMLVYNRVWLEYTQDSDIPQAAMARKLGMSVNTIKLYLGMEAKDIMPEEGKIGMVSEDKVIKELREAIPELQKRFERFGLICTSHPNLSPVDCLKKLNWSNDRKGKNLTIVTQFMQMKEFKYKFKNKEIKLIPND